MGHAVYYLHIIKCKIKFCAGRQTHDDITAFPVSFQWSPSEANKQEVNQSTEVGSHPSAVLIKLDVGRKSSLTAHQGFRELGVVQLQLSGNNPAESSLGHAWSQTFALQWENWDEIIESNWSWKLRSVSSESIERCRRQNCVKPRCERWDTPAQVVLAG